MAAALAADHPVRSSVISPRPVTAPIAVNGNQNGAIWIWKGSGHDTAAMTVIGLLNRHAKRPVAYALFVSTACTPKCYTANFQIDAPCGSNPPLLVISSLLTGCCL